MVKPPRLVKSSDYLREKYFPSLGVKQNGDLPLGVILNMGEKVKWSLGVKMEATNEEFYEAFMEMSVVWGMGP